MSDVPMIDEALDCGAADQSQSGARRPRRVDPVSLVAGLLFIAIASAALIDRFWADVDPVLVVGGVIVAVGVAIAAGVIRRATVRQD